MMNDISIRPYKPNDKDIILALIGEIQALELTLQTHLLPWDKAREAYWSWLQKNIAEKNGFIFLAERQNAAIGLAAGWLETDDYPAQKPEECAYGHVQDFVVTSADRKQGVGTMLMLAAEDYFKKQGVHIVKLYALANNQVANRFYLRHGMQQNLTIYKKYLKVAA